MQKLTILLQADGGGGMSSILMILLIFVVFYFFMIRPQQKKAKTEREFKEKIQKGDKVVTIGGVHGKIVEVQDRTFTVEVAENVRFRVEKSAISAEASKQFLEPQKQS
ncbi:MAG: preprotein translocase subunit YajC [Bacteroidia bacterium]